MKRFAFVLLLAGLLAGCTREHTILVCDACFEREGQMFCGRSETDQFKQKVPVTEEEGKLEAGRAACREFAARKGGGYNGPPFKKAFEECGAALTAKDLRRTRCDESVVRMEWNPKDGGL